MILSRVNCFSADSFLNHVPGGPVLDAAAGIGEFRFGQDVDFGLLAQPIFQAVQTQERRIADQVDDRRP